VAVAMAFLPINKLKSIIEIQNKYQKEKSNTEKNLNRFQILKQQ
jgi:hypothetical protein